MDPPPSREESEPEPGSRPRPDADEPETAQVTPPIPRPLKVSQQRAEGDGVATSQLNQQPATGEHGREAKERAAPGMEDFYVTIPYGLLVLGGGIAGYLKRGSTASLAAGAGFGRALLLAGALSAWAFARGGGGAGAIFATALQIEPGAPEVEERKAQRSYWEEHSRDLSMEAMMLDSRAAELDKEERPEIR